MVNGIDRIKRMLTHRFFFLFGTQTEKSSWAPSKTQLRQCRRLDSSLCLHRKDGWIMDCWIILPGRQYECGCRVAHSHPRGLTFFPQYAISHRQTKTISLARLPNWHFDSLPKKFKRRRICTKQLGRRLRLVLMVCQQNLMVRILS